MSFSVKPWYAKTDLTGETKTSATEFNTHTRRTDYENSLSTVLTARGTYYPEQQRFLSELTANVGIRDTVHRRNLDLEQSDRKRNEEKVFAVQCAHGMLCASFLPCVCVC